MDTFSTGKSLRFFAIKACVIALIFLTGQAFGQTIKNRHYSISYHPSDGSISGSRVDGTQFFKGNIPAAFVDSLLVQFNTDRYTNTVSRNSYTGKNTGLVIRGKDNNKQLNFVYSVSLTDSPPAIIVELTLENVGNKPIKVKSISPLRVLKSSAGGLHFRAEKCITNGAMYYDAGAVHSLSEDYIKPEPYGEMKGGIINDTLITSNPKTVQSWWNIGLFSDYISESIVVGYLQCNQSVGRFQVLKETDEHITLSVESVYNPGFQLMPGTSISSDKLAILIAESPYEALENYGHLMADGLTDKHLEPVTGWCNWFYTLDAFDENEILQNVRFAAKELKPYGLEFIQIDEGFQRTHGDWGGNERFPHGLKSLCDSIKSHGFKPGIWIAPFVISENAPIAIEHPEYLLKDQNGELQRIGPWPGEDTDWYRDETPKRYCLDITVPEAQQWLAALIDTVVNHWGFEMIKIDFVAWTVFSAYGFKDAGISSAAAYQKTMEIIRRAAGDQCHILECGPGHITAGNINSMRIEYDQNYGNDKNAWKQYFEGSSSSAGAMGKRYFFHNQAWINDVDHLCIDLLPGLNAQAAATLISLSGGNIMSGDRLLNLPATKLEILKKTIPGTIENARPVDLLDADPQTVFACHINREFGQWDLLAFFNTDRTRARTWSYSLQRLWLDTTTTYIGFDFWNEKFIGEISGNLTVSALPGGVSLLALHRKTGYPQVISTNRHIKQGAVELKTTSFNRAINELAGTSIGPADTSHSIFIYIPQGYYWIPANTKIYEINERYSARMISDEILRIDLFFDKEEKVDWRLKFVPNSE